MTLKLFATGFMAGMVIIGAAALASAAPDLTQSGPPMSNSTATTTPTTTASNAPTYPGHMGGY